jgi:hypothetical protein
MKMNLVSGSTIALAAVALAVSGATLAPTAAKAKTVMCNGANACKGQSSCKGANNSCKGQNACKGQGWVSAKSSAACKKAGGTVG